MSRNWWLLFVTMILGIWNAGIVWFTQIAVYPLWPLVGIEQFHDYHLTWWHDMWPSFGPVILMLVCSVILLWKVPAGVSKRLLWLGVMLQLAVHSLTAFFWAPVQAAMATNDGMSAVLYHELMTTHWFRVLFFLVYAGLMVCLVVRSLPNGRAQKAPGFANEAA